jgi:hypothetical protein
MSHSGLHCSSQAYWETCRHACIDKPWSVTRVCMAKDGHTLKHKHHNRCRSWASTVWLNTTKPGVLCIRTHTDCDAHRPMPTDRDKPPCKTCTGVHTQCGKARLRLLTPMNVSDQAQGAHIDAMEQKQVYTGCN